MNKGFSKSSQYNKILQNSFPLAKNGSIALNVSLNNSTVVHVEMFQKKWKELNEYDDNLSQVERNLKKSHFQGSTSEKGLNRNCKKKIHRGDR